MKKNLLVFVFAIIHVFVFTTLTLADPMTNLLVNPSAENGITGWTVVSGNWKAESNSSWHPIRTGSYFFFPGVTASAEMYQNIDLTGIADDIDSGIICGIAQGFVGSYENKDDCRIIIEYRDAGGNILDSEDSDWVTGPTTSWTQLDLPAYPGTVLPASTRTIRFRILGKRDNGADCDSYFEDLSWMYSIISPDNNSPSVPVVSGPDQVNTSFSETYSFISDDPDGDDISYQVDFGDGQISDWSGYVSSGAVFTAAHQWEQPGTYSVKARAKDTFGALSDWSLGLSVQVTGLVSGSFTYGPYLQNVTTDAITIMWVTNKMVTPSIAYSADGSYSNREYGTCIAESGVYICKVRLTGLDTETTYNYIAYAGSNPSNTQTFSTAPYEDAPFGFCVWGDSQQEVTPSNAFFTAMANSDTDFGLAAGDVVQDPTWAYTQNPFLKYTLNKLAKVKPVFIGYGNHDGTFTSIHRKFTEQPTTSNYTFTYGNAHFTVLDYADYGGSGWVGYVPTAWVEAALSSEEAQSAKWRFVVIHVPPYCERWISGNALLRSQLVPLLEQYDVDMVFSGHTHEYERGFLNDIYYVISGCGSYLDTAEPVVYDWDHMTVGGAQNIPPFTGGLAHGYAEIQINGNKLELKQHAYYSNGTYYGVIDTINITKVFTDKDFNFDGKVDYADLDYIVNDWTKRLSVDVYLGQNFNDVKDATSSSPAYIGNISTVSYQLPTLQPDTTYYWRIDETDTNGLHKGDIWQFTTGDNSSNIGWWKLDTSASDSSPAQNHGQIFGQMQTIEDPNWEQCLSFDGTEDYIQIPDESEYDLTNQMTIAAWVRLDTDQEGLYTIASKGRSYWLYIDAYTGKAVFSDDYSRPATSLKNMCDNKWHHIVAVFDAAERAIYIDGVKDASVTSSGAMVLNDTPFIIGNNTLNGESYNFKGSIRELRIYSSRLSDDQILLLSKAENHSPQPFNGMDNAGVDPELKFYPQYWVQDQTTDLNKDYVINFIDFAMFANEWLK